MRPAGALAIVRSHLLSSWGVFGAAVAVVAIATGALAVVAGLWIGLRTAVVEKLVGKLPVGVIEVTPPLMKLGPLAFNRPSFLGGAKLDEATIVALRRMPEIEWVEAEATLRLTSQARGEVFGRRFGTDLTISGLSPRLVAGDTFGGKPFDDPWPDSLDPDWANAEVPVLVSTQLVSLFNSNVAPALGLPRVNNEALSALQFKIFFGKSSILGNHPSGKIIEAPARIAGVSPRAVTLGITIPLRTLTRIERAFNVEGEREYTRAFVKVRRPDDIGVVQDKLSQMGFGANEAQRAAAALIALGLALPGALAGLLTAVAALTLALAFSLLVLKRRAEIALWRAVGATRTDVLAILMVEAVVIGALGSLAGLGLSVAVAATADHFARKLLSGLPFDVPSLFDFPPLLSLGVMAFGIVACVVGAWVPAAAAARQDPVKALRG